MLSDTCEKYEMAKGQEAALAVTEMFPPGTFFNVGGEPMLPGSGGGFPPTVGQEVASSSSNNMIQDVDVDVSTVKMYIYM